MNLFESPWDERDTSRLAEVLNRGTYWSAGPEVEEFEAAVAAISSRKEGLAFNSGTTALYSLLEALRVRGTEVIVPSFTFPATVNAVVLAGGKPVFADIETTTFGLDRRHVESLISPNTSAIVVVHFGGFVTMDIEDLVDVTAKNGLALIEDNAHSLAASRAGRPAGSFGLGAMTSHCFNKLIAVGEGGCLQLDDSELLGRLRRIRSHGRNPESGRDYDSVGFNFRLPSLSAAVGLGQLERLSTLVEERTNLAARYEQAFSESEPLTLPRAPEDQIPIWLLYNLLLPNRHQRDSLARALKDSGVPTRVTYPPVHLYSYYRENYGGSVGQLPATEATSERALTIPLYPGLSEIDQHRVISGILDFVNNKSLARS